MRVAAPPLRERRPDIPRLTEHYWEDVAAAAGSRARLAPGTVAALRAHRWPGNVRELQNVLANLTLTAPRYGTVEPAHLAAALRRPTPARPRTLAAAREDLERSMVRDALDRHRNVAAAAGELGLTRQGLSRMMARLEIDRAGPARERSGGGRSRLTPTAAPTRATRRRAPPRDPSVDTTLAAAGRTSDGPPAGWQRRPEAELRSDLRRGSALSCKLGGSGPDRAGFACAPEGFRSPISRGTPRRGIPADLSPFPLFFRRSEPAAPALRRSFRVGAGHGSLLPRAAGRLAARHRSDLGNHVSAAPLVAPSGGGAEARRRAGRRDDSQVGRIGCWEHDPLDRQQPLVDLGTIVAPENLRGRTLPPAARRDRTTPRRKPQRPLRRRAMSKPKRRDLAAAGQEASGPPAPPHAATLQQAATSQPEEGSVPPDRNETPAGGPPRPPHLRVSTHPPGADADGGPEADHVQALCASAIAPWSERPERKSQQPCHGLRHTDSCTGRGGSVATFTFRKAADIVWKQKRGTGSAPS